MKRMKKALLLPVRKLAFRFNRPRLYYWAERELYELRMINIMPNFYYRGLYEASMWLLEFRKFRWMANWAIHTIPYQIRFQVA